MSNDLRDQRRRKSGDVGRCLRPPKIWSSRPMAALRPHGVAARSRRDARRAAGFAENNQHLPPAALWGIRKTLSTAPF